MSGQKEEIVTLPQRELNRLIEQDARLRTVQEDLPDRLNRIQSDIREEQRQQQSRLDGRMRQFENTANHLRGELAEVERRGQRRLTEGLQRAREEYTGLIEAESAARQRQAHQMRNEYIGLVNEETAARIRQGVQLQQAVDQERYERQQQARLMREEYTGLVDQERYERQRQAEEMRAEYTGMIDRERKERERRLREIRAEYTSMIEQERQERQRQIGQLHSRLSSLEHNETVRQRLAEEWLDNVRTLQREIDRLPHQRFAPGRMERVVRLLERAESNLRSGATQTALGDAQDAYEELNELRAEVLFQEQLFEYTYAQALASVRSLIEEVRANSQARVGADQSIEVNVDFWSRGQLSRMQDRLVEAENHLEKDKDWLSLDEVRQLDNEAARLREMLPAAVYAARLNIINSQICYNVAEVVSGVMAEQGYEVIEGVYEGEDQRGAYAVKLQNRGGDEVVSIVTPSGTQELGYNLQMNFYDRSRDETARLHFANAVYEELNQLGLQATAPRTTLGPEQVNEEARDLESFRQRQTQLQSSARR